MIASLSSSLSSYCPSFPPSSSCSPMPCCKLYIDTVVDLHPNSMMVCNKKIRPELFVIPIVTIRLTSSHWFTFERLLLLPCWLLQKTLWIKKLVQGTVKCAHPTRGSKREEESENQFLFIFHNCKKHTLVRSEILKPTYRSQAEFRYPGSGQNLSDKHCGPSQERLILFQRKE